MARGGAHLDLEGVVGVPGEVGAAGVAGGDVLHPVGPTHRVIPPLGAGAVRVTDSPVGGAGGDRRSEDLWT